MYTYQIQRFVLSFCIIFILFGCSQSQPIQQTLPPVPFIPVETEIGTNQKLLTATPRPSLTATNVAGTRPEIQQPTAEGTHLGEETLITSPRYSFQVIFNYPEKSLTVQQTITFSAPAENLESIPLIVFPATDQNSFELLSVQINSLTAANIALENGIVWIYPKEKLDIGQKVEIRIAYTLAVPFRAARFGYTFRQVNFGDWYPMLPVYDHNQGWLISPPAPVGENITYPEAAFSVEIQVSGAPDSLLIAASAPSLNEGGNYQFTLNKGRNFSWSASPEYEYSRKLVGSTEIRSYYFSEHSEEGKVALDTAASAFELYSKIIGEINIPTLSIIEVDFRDGMEYQGLFFLGKEYYDEYVGSPKSHLVALSAHETGHQWFYGVVGNNQAEAPWLDESLCTYLELFYFENEYPEMTNWWWMFRVNRFNPQGWVNSTIYDYQTYRSYVDAVYLRGALYLDEVRSLIGDDQFLGFLKDYFSNNQGNISNADLFFEALAQFDGNHLNNLFPAYFKVP